MDRKRRHERVTLNITGDLVTSRIKVINISLSGALIEYGGRLDIGKGIRFALEVEGRAVILDGQIVRSAIARTEKNARGEFAPVYQAGVEFQRKLSQSEHDTLSLLVQ